MQFRGHLGTRGEAAPQIVSTIEFDRHDPTTLNIDLLLLGGEEERRAAILYLRHLHQNYVWLSSDEAGAPSVEVLGIQGISHRETQASINGAAVQVGITTEPQGREAVWHVRVELTPSGILIVPGTHDISEEGVIGAFRPFMEGVVEVSTSLGKLQVGADKDFYESEEYGNKVTHTVKRAFISGSINVAEGTDLFSVHEAFRAVVWDICTLLSLCYRQSVNYYEINYSTQSETTPEESQSAFLRRRLDSAERKIRQDELIHYNELVDGGLDQLLQAYNGSPHKEELSRAISFLASSYKVTTLESSYFLAYSAFDLVASMRKSGSQYLVGSSRWKKVQQLLSDYLDSIAEGQAITDVVEEMKKKLPELRRPSGESRIVEACQTLGVKTSDLWPKEGFEAGLAAATKMRNELFHSALLQSPDEASEHLVRVRTLVERLLLKILEWPDEKIWTWYDQNLKWINH